jgi:hypothetical protein
LYASSQGEAIIAALPLQVAVSETVADELDRETSRMSGQRGFVASLAERAAVSLLAMTDEEAGVFLELTSTFPSLDDGEAATIAIAHARDLTAVIDERKGRSRASALLAPRAPQWSLDLFCHPAVVVALGLHGAAEALYLALLRGRMRIAAERADAVIDLIGLERARQCTCLPNYRRRFAQQEKSTDYPVEGGGR